MIMFDSGHILHTRKMTGKLPGFMDQDRQVLRADPIMLGLEFQSQQRDIVAAAVAVEAAGCVIFQWVPSL